MADQPQAWAPHLPSPRNENASPPGPVQELYTMNVRLAFAAAALTLVVGCADNSPKIALPPGGNNAASADTGMADASPGPADTGVDLDAGPAADAAQGDLGLPDAGAPDSGGPDASPDSGPDVGPGPDGTCQEHGDCQRCAFPTAPRDPSQCYCTGCAEVPLSVATCEENQRAWEQHCGDGAWLGADEPPCPQPRCLAPRPVACMGGQCEDACLTVRCAALPCPAFQQETLPGECCPRCVGTDTCQSDADCTLCLHANSPEGPDQCQCPMCATHPTTHTACQARSEAFATQCGESFQQQCPVPLCLNTAPPVCGTSGYCEMPREGCQADEDCGYCPFSQAPRDASECQCAGCGTPMAQGQCQDILQKVSEVCGGFDFDACLPPPCPFPPALVCEPQSGACLMDFDNPR